MMSYLFASLFVQTIGKISLLYFADDCSPCSMLVGPICDLTVSVNGELASTVSDDNVVKVFDVVNFGN